MAKEMNNNMHVCSEPKVALDSCQSTYESLGYSSEELCKIVSFYLLHAPVLKNDKEPGDGKGLKCLSDYGWRSTADLNKLERLLLKGSGISRFVMVKADKIDEILSDMDLSDSICITHPRAVLKMSFGLSVSQYGEMKNDGKEKRLVCLFRHIRNSIAHNCVYLLNNDTILLEDMDESKTVSARILIPRKTLLDWIDIINPSIESTDTAISSTIEE